MKTLMTILFVLTLTNPTVDSGPVRKRSDDSNPLIAVVDHLSSQVTTLTAKVNAMQAKLDTQDQHPAFRVQFTDRSSTTPQAGPFKFNHVIFNDGNSYDPVLGVYTAPSTGVYIFSSKFYLRGKQSDHPIIDLKVNGEYIDRMAADISVSSGGHGDGSISSAVILRLKAGDRVWLESTAGRSYNIYGDFHSHFSGVLVAAE